MKKMKFLVLIFSIFFGLSILTSCDLFGNTEEPEIPSGNDDQKTYIYNLAVESGYTGTYEEWLESIKGDYIEISATTDKILWKYASETTWRVLIELSLLTGPAGADGTNGTNGVNGKTPEFRINEGYLEWKYTTDSKWTKLYEVDEKEEEEYCNVTVHIYNLNITKQFQIEKGEIITDLTSLLPENYSFDYCYAIDSLAGYSYQWLFDVYPVNKDLTLYIDNAYKMVNVTYLDFDGNVYNTYNHRSDNYFYVDEFLNGEYVEWYLEPEYINRLLSGYISSDIILYPKKIELYDYYVMFKGETEFLDKNKIYNSYPGCSTYIEMYLEAGQEFILASNDTDKIYNINNIHLYNVSYEGTDYIKITTSGLYRIGVNSYSDPSEYAFIELVHAYQKAKPDNMLNDYYRNESGCINVDYYEDRLEVIKTGWDDWANIRSSVLVPEIVGLNKLVVEIQGEKDSRILFKIADRYEYWVECDGTVQQFEFDFRLDYYNEYSCALYMFPEGGRSGTTSLFTLTDLHFEYDPTNELKVYFNDEVIYSEYDSMTDTHSLSVTLNPGETFEILFENRNVFAAEIPTITGAHDYNDSTENYLCVFAGIFRLNPNNTSRVKYDITYNVKDNLIDFVATPLSGGLDCIEYGFYERDSDSYVIKQENNKLIINKTYNGHEWSFIASNLSGADIIGFSKLVIKVKGEEGQEIIFKVNEQRETIITCDGTEQTIEFDFDNIIINPNVYALIIFAGPGNYGVTPEFIIYELYFE